MKTPTRKITLFLPLDVCRELARARHNERVSISTFVAAAIRDRARPTGVAVTELVGNDGDVLVVLQ